MFRCHLSKAHQTVSVLTTADMNNKHFLNIIKPLIPNVSYRGNFYCFSEVFLSYFLLIIFIKRFPITLLFLHFNIYIYILTYFIHGAESFLRS